MVEAWTCYIILSLYVIPHKGRSRVNVYAHTCTVHTCTCIYIVCTILICTWFMCKLNTLINCLLPHTQLLIDPRSSNEKTNCRTSSCAFKGVQMFFWNMPQNISLKSNSYTDHCGTPAFLPLLRYELRLFSYFEISATRSAFRGGCTCAHCVLQPAGQLTIIAYTHAAGPLPPPLPYTSVEKLFYARSIYFT